LYVQNAARLYFEGKVFEKYLFFSNLFDER
jgi:hypothetical protein